MKNLIPKEISITIPALYETEEQKDPTVYVKLFLDGWTWHITEMSRDDICFGYVISPFCSGELGYFSLAELLELKGSLGIGVERDLSFSPAPLSKIKKAA
jgi:hypothetical protein